MEETFRRRGHHYVSHFVDLDESRVLFATDGKDASTVCRFKKDLIDHGGNPEAIDQVRREETKTRPELLKTRYLWLKNPRKLKDSQARRVEQLSVSKLNLKTRGLRDIHKNIILSKRCGAM
jgi:transposase